MYEITISDSTGSLTLPALEVPLTTTTLEGATDVQTLDYNIYTDFITTKRTVSHTWSYMTETEFNALKAYYDRQFTLFQYPQITITKLGITNMTARFTLNPQSIIDHCGTVQGVTVSFRESKQNPVSS